jgi:hypothetical protein
MLRTDVYPEDLVDAVVHPRLRVASETD